MKVSEIINIHASRERPAAKVTGYEYKASLRRLGLVVDLTFSCSNVGLVDKAIRA